MGYVPLGTYEKIHRKSSRSPEYSWEMWFVITKGFDGQIHLFSFIKQKGSVVVAFLLLYISESNLWSTRKLDFKIQI